MTFRYSDKTTYEQTAMIYAWPSKLLPLSVFPPKTPYAGPYCPMCAACPTHLILFNIMTLTVPSALKEDYRRILTARWLLNDNNTTRALLFGSATSVYIIFKRYVQFNENKMRLHYKYVDHIIQNNEL